MELVPVLSDPRGICSYRSAYHTFLQSFPQYAATEVIDAIRGAEYSHLDGDQVCFDYNGIGIFSGLSVHHNFAMVYSSACLVTHALYEDDQTTLEGRLRRRILGHMKLSQKEYCIVFAADAFSAIRLLVESFPFDSFNRLLLGYDFEHQSLSRIQQTALQAGAKLKLVHPKESLRKKLQLKKKHKQDQFKGLFAYPLNSRVTGAKNSAGWICEAQQNGWSVVVDASNTDFADLDLKGLAPDFIASSFYKVFGMDPSGFGCLAIRKQMLPKLRETRASGMVKIIPLKKLQGSFLTRSLKENNSFNSLQESRGLKTAGLSCPLQENTTEAMMDTCKLSRCRKFSKIRRFQLQRSEESDSTSCLPRLSFPGLDYAERFSKHSKLRQELLLLWLRTAFLALRHPAADHPHLVKIHSPEDAGPTFAFSLHDFHGDVLNAEIVQKLANRSNISLATGAIQLAATATRDDFEFGVKKTQGSCLRKPSSETAAGGHLESFRVICATFGFLTSFWDVYQLWKFIAQFLDSGFCSRELLRYEGLNQETVIL